MVIGKKIGNGSQATAKDLDTKADKKNPNTKVGKKNPATNAGNRKKK